MNKKKRDTKIRENGDEGKVSLNGEEERQKERQDGRAS